MHICAECGYEELLGFFYDLKPEWCTFKDENSRTPYQVACFNEQDTTAEFFEELDPSLLQE